MDLDLEQERVVELPPRLETSRFFFSPVNVNVTQSALALNAVNSFGTQNATAWNRSFVDVG